MASVTFSAGVGGDGSTVTDDSNASTGLAAGGHRTRFVPALAQVVAVAGHVVTKAGEANDDAVAAAASAVSAAASAVAADASADAAAASAIAAAESAASASGGGLQTIFMPSGAMTLPTNSPALAESISLMSGDLKLPVLSFDPATNEFATFAILMPKSWDRSTVTAMFTHFHSSGSGNVQWGMRCKVAKDGDALSGAWGTSGTIQDINADSTATLYTSGTTGAITPGGTPSSTNRNLLICSVFRDATSGNDLLATDAHLVGVHVYYNTTAGNDA